MAYNNYFPTGYMPQYYTPSQQYQPQAGTQMSSPQQSSSIIWVSGEAGAKAYLVAPNTTVQLWDSEAQVIYLKSADASGMPSMKIIDYTIRDTSPSPVPQSNQGSQSTQAYVTKDEFDAFKQQVQKMIGGGADESTVSTDRQHSKQSK